MVVNRRSDVRIPKPRRLRTAYSYFVKENYRRLSQEMKTNRPQPIIKRVGEMWRQLSAGEREAFTLREQRDRTRYKQARDEWVRQHAGRPMGYLNRKKKEREAPKRVQSAFLIFRSDLARSLREEMPNATNRERNRETIRRWRTLDETTREKYLKRSVEDRLRYAKEMHSFRANALDRSKAEEQKKRLERLAADQQPPPPPAPPGPDRAFGNVFG